MNNETIIYLAITRNKNRLVISGSFDLYREFMQASLPPVKKLREGTINNPAPEMDPEAMPPDKTT
jgi:hypothetical protein